VSASGRRAADCPAPAAAKTADFRDSGHLARLMLDDRDRGNPMTESDMERFENLAFAIGFIATGLLTLVAQVTIV
jgi:hypothetical protein